MVPEELAFGAHAVGAWRKTGIDTAAFAGGIARKSAVTSTVGEAGSTRTRRNPQAASESRPPAADTRPFAGLERQLDDITSNFERGLEVDHDNRVATDIESAQQRLGS